MIDLSMEYTENEEMDIGGHIKVKLKSLKLNTIFFGTDIQKGYFDVSFV